VNDSLVPVVTTQTVVTGGGANLNGREIVVILANFQQGNVERTATEVKDENQFVFFTAFQTVGQRSRGRFVDDTRDVQASDFAGFFSGLAFGVVEVRGNGDDRVGDFFPEVLFGVVLELHQNAGRDFLGGV